MFKPKVYGAQQSILVRIQTWRPDFSSFYAHCAYLYKCYIYHVIAKRTFIPHPITITIPCNIYIKPGDIFRCTRSQSPFFYHSKIIKKLCLWTFNLLDASYNTVWYQKHGLQPCVCRLVNASFHHSKMKNPEKTLRQRPVRSFIRSLRSPILLM